jgi:hypothetical protein
LRFTPGRRVEVQYIEGGDLRDVHGVWRRGDSSLVAAGSFASAPPRTAARSH